VLVAAAVVPAAPLLVPEVAGGSAPVDEVLRSRAREVVAALLTARPERVVVVGTAPATGPVTGTWDWSGLGVPRAPGRSAGPALPLSLGIGDWLLDDAGWTGTRAHHGLARDASPQGCAELGRSLAAGAVRVALLVCGGGSACRTEKAPGHLDPRAEEFDRRAAQALSDADLTGLRALEPDLAEALLADGRGPWQVLAGAAQGVSWQAELCHDEAPYGVAYLVAHWRAQATGRAPAA